MLDRGQDLMRVAERKGAFNSATRARNMLLAAGFTEADIRIEGEGKRWLVAVHGLGAGATDETDATMDEPHEVAAALLRGYAPAPPISDAEAEAIAETVALFDDGGEAEQDSAHETHGETGEAAEAELGAHVLGGDNGRAELDAASERDDVSVRLPSGLGELDAGSAEGMDATSGGDAGGIGAESDLIDADFDTIEIPEELDEADFGAELLADYPADLPRLQGADAPEVTPEPPQDRFYGLDDLDRRRSLRIGDVVQLSLDKQASIWAEANVTEGEFSRLQNAVLRDTVDGMYRGDPALYERFVALQGYANAANSVRAVEHDKVVFLRDVTTHAALEAFDVEAGWP